MKVIPDDCESCIAPCVYDNHLLHHYLKKKIEVTKASAERGALQQYPDFHRHHHYALSWVHVDAKKWLSFIPSISCGEEDTIWLAKYADELPDRWITFVDVALDREEDDFMGRVKHTFCRYDTQAGLHTVFICKASIACWLDHVDTDNHMEMLMLLLDYNLYLSSTAYVENMLKWQ